MKVDNINIFVAFLILIVLSHADCQNCSNTLSVLENALYANGQNRVNLEKAFFPSIQLTSRFLRVVYNFTDGADGDCVVTYFWSVGGFLFIQPPTVFKYTSLFFNFPANNVDNVTITLPNECRSLVKSESSGKCSCKNPGITFLDLLTRHVS